MRVDRRSDTDRGQRGIKDYKFRRGGRIFDLGGQPGGTHERIHGSSIEGRQPGTDKSETEFKGPALHLWIEICWSW